MWRKCAGGVVVSGNEYRAMVMCRVFEHKRGGRDEDSQERQCIANRSQPCDIEGTWPLELCHLWRSRPLSL